MKVKISGRSLTLYREEGDPRYKAGGWAEDPDGTVLYHLKKLLNAAGLDLIKKRMWRDGHLTDDRRQYLRVRSPASKTPHIAIMDDSHAIRSLATDLMKNGEATLTIVLDYYEKQPDCRAKLEELAKKVTPPKEELDSFLNDLRYRQWTTALKKY